MVDNTGYVIQPSPPEQPSTLTSEDASISDVELGPPPPYISSPPPISPGTPLPAYLEMQPPHAPPLSTEPSVFCRICRQLICIGGKEDEWDVQCGNCQNTTPIKPLPAGRKYIQCIYKSLLTCDVSSTRISCHFCRRIMSLAQAPSMSRVACRHCNKIFDLYETSGVAKCPHCRNVETFLQGSDDLVERNIVGTLCRRATIYAIIGLLFLAVGIGVTVYTFKRALESSGGVIVVRLGAYVAGIFNLIMSFTYCSMACSQSTTERDIHVERYGSLNTHL